MAVRAETDITLTRVDDGSAGANGATFTPSVDASGDISWTNDGGLPNPATQNIMGPAGASGISVTSVKTQYYLSTSDSSATGGEWSDTPQEFVSGYYYWTRDYIDYSDGTHDTSTPVYNQGLTLANEYSIDAKSQAVSAYNSASTAINQLSVVENIVGVLDLISKNGTYAVTTDTEPQPDKWYFTRSGSGTQLDPYVYNIIVPDPSDDPSALGYYELVDIDQSIQNYVSSHLALTSEGLNLQNGATRMLLSTTDGMILYDQNGNQIAQYGNSAIIGDSQGFHIEIDNTEIGFYQAAQKVAYINGNKLYITQSVVLQQMDVGTPVVDGGLGQWSWKVHEVNGANNLYLKWLG